MTDATVYLTRKVGSTDWKQGEIVRHDATGVHLRPHNQLQQDEITFYPAHLIEKIVYTK
jgi:hypothetical protein